METFQNVIVMFDEMYLQKREEFCSGETFGADENGRLYKGVLYFMIVGLKSNIPCVVKTVPEQNVGDWAKNELLVCLKILQENGFNVSDIVCDEHSTNVLAYKNLIREFGQSSDNLFIMLNRKKPTCFLTQSI